MEAAQRFCVMWLAAQQNNWALAAFEAREAEGVLRHGAVRSNQSGDQTRFQAAYSVAIYGRNERHASQNYGAINRPLKEFSRRRLHVRTLG
jgi:hypothetical protein